MSETKYQMNDIETKLKELMDQKRMSMGMLSDITKIPKTTIFRYLNDAGTIPTDRLSIIAEALNTTPEYLLGWVVKEENDTYGNHKNNLDYFSDKPELLDIYKEIHDSESLQLLFDNARDLEPEDLEAVLNHIILIKKARSNE